MNPDYSDIRDRIAEPPTWWDAGGVPRYGAFHPRHLDIYAKEAALAEIACQACGERFNVAFTWGDHDLVERILRFGDTYEAAEQVSRLSRRLAGPDGYPDLGVDLGYGDPPNTGCCRAGPTMSADWITLLELWEQDAGFEWQRVPLTPPGEEAADA